MRLDDVAAGAAESRSRRFPDPEASRMRGCAAAALFVVNTWAGAVYVWPLPAVTAGVHSAPSSASGASIEPDVPSEPQPRRLEVTDPNPSHVEGPLKPGHGLAPPIPARPPLTAAALRRALGRSASFVEGRGGPLVSAFIDLDCAFCARLYDESRPLVDAGTLRVRWIPVALIGRSSLGFAAAILLAADRPHALAAAQRGSLAPIVPPGPLREAIAANNALLSVLASGLPATPLLLAERADGSFMAHLGLPPDLRSFAAAAAS